MKFLKPVLIIALIFILFSNATECAEIADPEVRAHFSHPKIVDQDSLEFNFGNNRGLQLRPGQAFELLIPAEFSGRFPDYAYIEHRKEPFYFIPDDKGIDPNDARLRVDFYNPESKNWVSWSDQFGPLKRSAVRPAHKPKKNTLYNLRENVGIFSPTRVRIVNLGIGDGELAVASVHKLGLTYLHQRELGAETSAVFSKFTRVNHLLIRFTLNSQQGIPLPQNSSFAFIIPEEFRHRPIFHVILKHRKDPEYAADPDNYDAMDPNAAYVLCEVRDRRTGFWHKWADRSSLKKFSEVRTADNPENETLHNCLRTFGQIEPERFRLTNAGIGDPKKSIAQIHELEILFAPDVAGSRIVEEIFTPETEFNRPDQRRPVPLIGGGPRLGGKFPDALILGPGHIQRQAQILSLPEKFQFSTQQSGKYAKVNEPGELEITIPAGYHLESLEMALGDLDITSLAYNKDGYFGRSGKAVANAWLERNGKKLYQILDENNVGMAGMVVCGGPGSVYTSEDGDLIKVKVENDNAFLMGYRLLLKAKEM